MRLIDVDKLRKPIYAEDDNITGCGMSPDEQDGYNDGIDTVWSMIQNAPTVDAVEVVRCKDCKHFRYYGKTSLWIDGKNIVAGWCYRRVRYEEEFRMTQNDFCSYGERKSGTQPQREGEA